MYFNLLAYTEVMEGRVWCRGGGGVGVVVVVVSCMDRTPNMVLAGAGIATEHANPPLPLPPSLLSLGHEVQQNPSYIFLYFNKDISCKR